MENVPIHSIHSYINFMLFFIGSHSLWLLATYIKGQTPFPEFSYVGMLDDVKVLYYNGETKTLIPRGNTTTEDDVLDSKVLLTISDNIQSSFIEKWVVATRNVNKTYSKYKSQFFDILIETLYTIK